MITLFTQAAGVSLAERPAAPPPVQAKAPIAGQTAADPPVSVLAPIPDPEPLTGPPPAFEANVLETEFRRLRPPEPAGQAETPGSADFPAEAAPKSRLDVTL